MNDLFRNSKEFFIDIEMETFKANPLILTDVRYFDCNQRNSILISWDDKGYVFKGKFNFPFVNFLLSRYVAK